MSQMNERDKQVFVQVLAQIVSGTLEQLKQEGKGDCIRTVVGNAMYGVKLHEKGGIEIFQLGAGLLQEDKQEPVVIECEKQNLEITTTRKADKTEHVDKVDSAIDLLIK